jgi:tRNA dimethylallyltransferase
MQRLVSGHRLPLLVGGTMFYFRALQYGLPALPSADPATRAKIGEEASRHGWPALHDRLAEVDPASARRIDRNDRQRIMRALEIYRLTGNPPSNYPTSQRQVIPYRVIKVGIWPARRSVLHERIATRLEQMFADGFIDEVKKLQARGLDPALPALRAVGYRQVLEYLRGELDYEQMRARCLATTRQLAKRQLTWLRHDPQIHWFDSEMPDYVEKVLDFVQKNTSVQAIDL